MLRRLFVSTLVMSIAAAACGGSDISADQAAASMCLHLGGPTLLGLESPAFNENAVGIFADALSADVSLLREAGEDDRADRLERLASELDRMRDGNLAAARLYLSNSVENSGVDALRGELEGNPGLTVVDFESKAEALERFRRVFGDHPELLENVGEDALPASFLIRFPASDATELRTSFEDRTEVEAFAPKMLALAPKLQRDVDELAAGCPEYVPLPTP